MSPYRLTPDTADAPDPVLVEIVGGYLASVEMEVETAIGRTSRSPMIRDAHDYRAGIHDRNLQEADRPLVFRTGQPCGPRLSDGDDGSGRRVLPQRRLLVRGRHRAPSGPLRDGSGVPRRPVVGFVQAFGHHDDIGGTVPGSMPSHATRRKPDGAADPAVGVPAEAALKIMTRNSRMPESLAADLDAECSACLMGTRRLGELFERYGRAAVESCFDAIIDNTTRTFRRRSCP